MNARLQTKSYVRSIYVLCLRGRVLLIKNCKSYTLKKNVFLNQLDGTTFYKGNLCSLNMHLCIFFHWRTTMNIPYHLLQYIFRWWNSNMIKQMCKTKLFSFSFFCNDCSIPIFQLLFKYSNIQYAGQAIHFMYLTRLTDD